MNLNLFLLFLTTLITVVLSENVFIKLKNRPLFWSLRGDMVVLEGLPFPWKFENNRISPLFQGNLFVQCNDIDRPLTVKPPDSKPDQLWEFQDSTFLCKAKSPEPEFANVIFEEPGEPVITGPNNHSLWEKITLI
uniref:Sensitive to high expression protein 9, mitochondrial n=1 Tax=Anthurium amnicola TaxID=1678845 RepID=A0A1D1Y6R8_9ARAE